MALLKEVMIRPGVVKDTTALDVEARWVDTDKIRWVRGRPQPIGGWTKFNENAFLGKARGLLAWLDNSGVSRLAVGTNMRLYVAQGVNLVNITPAAASGNLTDPFTTTSGLTAVTVTDTAHGLVAGQYVNFDGASAVGGITIDGDYVVATVPTADSYTIAHSSAASSSASGGGTVAYVYDLAFGRVDAVNGAGWGVGTYGSGTWGTARSTSIILPPRVWSIDQWGPYILALPTEGNLYEWVNNTNLRAALVTNAPTDSLAMFVTAEKHVVLLGAGGSRMLVQWCDQDDNTTWTPASTNTAGSRTLTGGSRLFFGIRTERTNLVFADRSVWAMTFVGGQDVFGFDLIAGAAAGIVGPHGATEMAGVVYWMGQENFFLFNGTIRLIPNAANIVRYVFDRLNRTQSTKVYCGVNSAFTEIWWLYPSTDGVEVDSYVMVNIVNFEWAVGSLARSAVVDKDLFDYPLMAGTDGYLYQHEDGADADGSALGETLTTSPLPQIRDGTRMMEIFSVIPDFSNLDGALNVTVITRSYPQSTAEEVSFGNISSTTEKVDGAAQGREVSLKFTGSVTRTQPWRMGTIHVEIERGGER